MPPPSASVKAKGKGRARVPFTSAKASKAALESSPLVQDVVKPLEERGFLAASLSSGARKWQGVILLPAREDGDGGPWEERRVRLEKIEKGEGHYRRMDIKWVLFSHYVVFKFTFSKCLKLSPNEISRRSSLGSNGRHRVQQRHSNTRHHPRLTSQRVWIMEMAAR